MIYTLGEEDIKSTALIVRYKLVHQIEKAYIDAKSLDWDKLKSEVEKL